MMFMPAALRDGWQRAILLAMVVSVCAYALRAKLSLYDPPHPGTVNPAAASKLWAGGEKGKTELRGATQVLLPMAFLTLPHQERGVVCHRDLAEFIPHYLRFPEFNRLLRSPPAARLS